MFSSTGIITPAFLHSDWLFSYCTWCADSCRITHNPRKDFGNPKMCRCACTYTHTGVLFRKNLTPHKSGLKLTASSFINRVIIEVLC